MSLCGESMSEIMTKTTMWPKSPEPTLVGAGGSASRFTVFGPALGSFS